MADAQGELGLVYGRQWRSWPTPDGQAIDQISKVLEQLRQDPNSRRIIVSAWNVAELDRMVTAALPLFISILMRLMGSYLANCISAARIFS